MTKVKPTNEVAKEGLRHPKNGSIHKKKQQKFKNTPTGKVALVDGKNAQQKGNGKLTHQNGNQKHQNSPKQNKSPKGSNKHSNSPKSLNLVKSPKVKIEEEQDDDDSSIDDINEGISIKEEISAPEDEVDDDSSSAETESVPNIFGQSLAEETDEDDAEFDADSDEDEEATAENKGVKMFKGLKPKAEPKESSDDDEDAEDDDDDADSSDEETESAPSLKDLLGDSIADESDDEDFKSGGDSDDESDEEIDQSLNSSNAPPTTDEDDDEEDDDDDDDEEDSSDDEAAPDLTALLGNSIAEDSDDEDFEGDENDEDDEDEDMSEDDDDEDTPTPKKKVKVVKAADAEREDDDDDEKNESVESTNDKSDADDSEKPPKMTAEERKERDARTIFIGNIPKETKVSRIKTMFKKFGTIESIRVRGIIPETPKMPLKVAAIKKKFHSKSKTICMFVTFETVEAAEKAITAMNGKTLDGNYLRVDHANQTKPKDKNRTVFLGNLPFTVEDNEIWEAFKACGKIESVRIIRDRNTGVGRGFGYINFETVDGAVLAMDLNGTTIHNRELRVKVNTPEGKKKQRAEKKGKKRQLTESDTADSPKKLKTGSETAQVAKHNSVNAERRTDKKKRSQGEKQRVKSESTSPEGKGAGKFQGQKADSKKKSKPNKHAKKKMQMAAKLLAKPKKPSAN